MAGDDDGPLVYEGEGPLAVVFLHGVQGHRTKTWTHEESGFEWPKAFHEQTRWTVATVGYPAAILWDGNTMDLEPRANNVLEHLELEARLRGRKLAIVAHSYGGLIAKQMFRVAHDRPQRTWFRDQLRAISFVATPHRGAALANFAQFLRMGLGSTKTIDELRLGSPTVESLHKWYVDHCGGVQQQNFGERQALGRGTSPRGVTRRLIGAIVRKLAPAVVQPISSEIGMAGVNTVDCDEDHISIAKQELGRPPPRQPGNGA